MIIGSLVGIEEVSKLSTETIDESLQIALDEIRTNPIIDQHIRKDRVIMRELTAAVKHALKSKVHMASAKEGNESSK